MLADFLEGKWIHEHEYRRLLFQLSPPLCEGTLLDAICTGKLQLELQNDLYRGAMIRCVDGADFIERLRAHDAQARLRLSA